MSAIRIFIGIQIETRNKLKQKKNTRKREGESIIRTNSFELDLKKERKISVKYLYKRDHFYVVSLRRTIAFRDWRRFERKEEEKKTCTYSEYEFTFLFEIKGIQS